MKGKVVQMEGQALAVRPSPGFEFTPEQQKMIRESFLNGASESEALVLMELARLRRLNPITRQIHFVKRWDSQKRAEVWSAQVGIDGFRAIAERTGRYDGQDAPEYEYDAKGILKVCRVKIYRADWTRPAVGVAHFSEYAQFTKEGKLTSMWATKPHVMLAKCAEALGFRKAFPEDTSGLYAPEEMPGETEVLPVSAPLVTVNAMPPASTQPPPESASVPKSGTARVKAAMAARKGIIDVQAGETEDQAIARAAAAPGNWKRVVEIGAMYGKTEEQMKTFASAVMQGRTKVTAQDVRDIQDALTRVSKPIVGQDAPGVHVERDEVPPPSDDDVPPPESAA